MHFSIFKFRSEIFNLFIPRFFSIILDKLRHGQAKLLPWLS
ncbi:Hypothetical protein ETEE_2770 [Edwardsiella anguillarum ET080813]|uniref:Uncharacterized protein n=1 Tax=Edwardsiella anguillarum ET080813 TaxID=667120 RepID=A0A076LRM2_9GAMM|nr:Hypothetical protein ETEE_2770 [Edwardsiella anguillarum ET080813]